MQSRERIYIQCVIFVELFFTLQFSTSTLYYYHNQENRGGSTRIVKNLHKLKFEPKHKKKKILTVQFSENTSVCDSSGKKAEDGSVNLTTLGAFFD